MSVQWPVADLRNFIPGGLKLRRPTWPDSEPGEDFVRGFGMVRARPRGPIHYWSGDAAYCNAGRRVQLTPEPPVHHVNHVRLFGSEWNYRLDFGLTVHSDSPTVSDHVLAKLLGTAVQVAGAATSLGTGSRSLAFLLSRATTPHNVDPADALRWLRTAPPMVLVEEAEPKDANAALRQSSVIIDANRVPIYRSAHLPHSQDVKMRQVRGVLWRLHSELETLRVVARQWKRDPSVFNEAELARYLSHCADVMLPNRWGGVNQHLLLALEGGLEGTEISALLGQVQLESAGIQHRLALLQDRARSAGDELDQVQDTVGGIIALQFNILTGEGASVVNNKDGDTHITGDQFNFKGPSSGVFGANAQVAGSNFHSQTGLTADDIARLWSGLGEVRERVSSEVYSELASSISQLASSPESEQPSRLKTLFSRLKQLGDATQPLSQIVLPLMAALGTPYPGIPGS